MKKSFAARRMPRKIGGDDEGEAQAPGSTTMIDASDDSQTPSVVRRPTAKSRKSGTARTPLSASAFNTDEDEDASSVVTPKRGNLSRLAIQHNASQRNPADMPFRAGRDDDDDRPSYSKGYLNDLKQSTPNTPKTMSDNDDGSDAAGATKAIDLSSKFGTDMSRYKRTGAIPTDTEIREKKARRARLAKEQEYMPLDGGDGDEASGSDDENVTRDDSGRLILKPKEKYTETRLVRDDEDILEDFDDFTSDGRMALGRKAEREADQKRRTEMAALIADAEDSGDEDGSDGAGASEAERNAAFEVAQTRHGTYAARGTDKEEEIARPRTPPRIAPLPSLDGVLDRLRSRLTEMELKCAATRNEMEGLREEKKGIASEEVRVQAALKETGEKYAKLREEMGEKAGERGEQVARVNGDNGDGGGDGLNGSRMGLGAAGLGFGAPGSAVAGRGLESLGSTPMAGTPLTAGSDSSDDY